MNFQKKSLGNKPSFSSDQSRWVEIPEAATELICGGATGDGPYCDPDKGYVLPPWYIIGNEGGQEGEYSGDPNW